VLVLHVFDEAGDEEQALHMEHWFGYPEASPIFIQKDAQMVCYCGGRLIPLKRNVKDASDVQVAAVWHLASWVDDQWLPGWADNE
jgi:hypothetical protein